MKFETILSGLAFFMSAAALGGALSQPNDNPRTSPPPKQRDDVRVSLIEGDVRNLWAELEALTAETYDLKTEAFITKLGRKSAIFSPTESSFQIIDAAPVYFLVSLKNVERLGDGYKLTFHVGNPTNMTIHGLTGRVSWQPNAMAESEKAGSKEFKVLPGLIPGVWNKVEVNVGPADEQSIARITVSALSFNEVSFVNSY